MDLLTSYGSVSVVGSQSRGYWLVGRIELGEWAALSVESERRVAGPSIRFPSTATSASSPSPVDFFPKIPSLAFPLWGEG